MTHVVVSDPIPAGSDAARPAALAATRRIASAPQLQRPLHWRGALSEERTFEAYRAYYHLQCRRVSGPPEYTVRLNNDGRFELPQTRVEAMYAPEMFGELQRGSGDPALTRRNVQDVPVRILEPRDLHVAADVHVAFSL